MQALVFALVVLATPASKTWPGFLGAGARAVEASKFALTWSPGDNIAWTAELPGHGQSSPIVWEDKVFVTSVEGPMKDQCHVTALSLMDGSVLWKHSQESSYKVENSLYVSRAAPTPVTDGRAIYAYFESGDVVALALDGQVQWRRSLTEDYGQFKSKFGLAASPVQTDRAVIILVDDEGPSYLLALDKGSGKTLWKKDRTSRTSWSSPVLVAVGGVEHVVCSSAGSVDGYDPADGKLLWSYEDVGGNTAASPLQVTDGTFLVGASAGQQGERAQDAQKSNLMMKIETAAGTAEPTVVWRTEEAQSSFGSPIVHQGCAYWVNRSGVVFCFDAADGKSHYTKRLPQSCWATPIGSGDRVYFFGKDGLTTVLRAGAEFEVLAENQLWDPDQVKVDPAEASKEIMPERRQAAANFSGPVQYGVAAVDGHLLIRTGQRLYCVRDE